MVAKRGRYPITGRSGRIGLGLVLLLCAGGAGKTQSALPQQPPSVQPARKEAPASLATLIEQSNWKPAQRGPLLALDPAHVLHNRESPLPVPGPSGYDLRTDTAGYDRMLVSVGTLSVLAPTQMTLIEDRPRERPNLYDGLPRQLKVKYLMATLNPQQWKILGEQGLGLDNLTAEQQPVFLSLLPDPFIVRRRSLDAEGAFTDDSRLITLTPQERTQVRLQVYRSAQIMAPLVDAPRTYTSVSVSNRPGPPNGAYWERDQRAEARQSDIFGVNLLSIVPNKFKPSQLDYAASVLNASVSLEGANTLGDLINRIHDATRLELYADGRVAGLPLLTRGGQARAGDLLKALALAVTGTYRRVGPAFLLTSDLTGIGTRQMRLTEWQEQIRAEVAQMEQEIVRQIREHSGAKSGIRSLGYAPNDPAPLTPEIEQEARQHPELAAERLTPALQQLLRDAAAQRAADSPNGSQMSAASARIDVNWRFAFQLPNGALLPMESGMVGHAGEYETTAQTAPPRAADLRPIARRPLPAGVASRTLFLTPRTPQEAEVMAQTANRLGFTELVLYTEERDMLQAAILTAAKMQREAGAKGQTLHICAAVAPWAASDGSGTGSDSLDINLMGETAAQIVAARNSQPRWNTFLQHAVASAGPPLTPERVVGVSSALPPVGPITEAHFRKLALLARMEGLSGLFLCDTQPGGYAGLRADEFSTNDHVLTERENLGYSPALRLAFLRKAGVDPLDLTPPGISVSVDLPLPFFPDQAAASRSSQERHALINYSLQKGKEWDTLRAETNRKAMANLFALLHDAAPQLPLLLEARAAMNNEVDPARFRPAWASWTQPEALLIGAPNLHEDAKRPPLPSGERSLFPAQFSASELVPVRMTMRDYLEPFYHTDPSAPHAEALALDLRYLAASRALALLNEWIAPAP